MAFYKQPASTVARSSTGTSASALPAGAAAPFGYLCPACLRPIEKGQARCQGCGRVLYTVCPKCGSQTFVQEYCERCGAPLMRLCPNSRCGALQFFENEKCTVCGKKTKFNNK